MQGFGFSDPGGPLQFYVPVITKLKLKWQHVPEPRTSSSHIFIYTDSILLSCIFFCPSQNKRYCCTLRNDLQMAPRGYSFLLNALGTILNSIWAKLVKNRANIFFPVPSVSLQDIQWGTAWEKYRLCSNDRTVW